MADEIIIKIGTEADLTGAETVDDLIEEIRSNAEVEISVDVDDSSIQDATDTTIELEDELGNVDSTVATPEVDTSSLEEASASAEETASSIDNITTAAAGIAATAGVEQMMTTADNINTSWNRLELTFKGTGVSMDTLKTKANALNASTGRSGGAIRDYFNQMGIAGVTNTDLLSSSFEALSGKAYQTGNSIETMEGKMQMMVMSGNASNRMLKTLGITTEDLARAMGVSADEVSNAFKDMTPEQRIQAITQAMGEGKEANEMYKNSYAGLKDRANAAMAGLAGAVGQAILPVVIPALEAATNFVKLLTDGFKALPGPVQAVIGGILGFAAIATTLIGTLGMVGKVIGTVKTGLETIGMLSKITSIISSIGGALSSLWGILIANPIILVVVAIVALIAALVWAYYNVDWFRAMVDNAWASITQFAGQLMGAVTGAINWVAGLFQQFTAQLGLNTNDWGQAILGFILFLPTLPLRVAAELANVIAHALGFKGNFIQTLWDTAMGAVENFANAIQGIPRALQACLDWAYNIVMSNPLVQALQWLGEQAVNAFSIMGLNQGSPGDIVRSMENELNWTKRAVLKSDLADTTQKLGASLSDSFDPHLANGTLNGSVVNGSIGGQVNNFYFSDVVVDNDERMNRIVEYVRKNIHWNNQTAGRSV